ncbi:membrane protease YdiL (CAAX protease family) [Gracilibacillus alcaliphilus]|nr:type II CAAX endopeptidase family protein [Gracilibacillus alcaliphilus]MBM7678911.1 membrane protease YdiL (CAAX protease family) [Gracilibacillus alcaliphilus]
MLTNLIFLPLFCLVGLISLSELPEWLFDLAFCVSAWSSTFAFVILFHKIYPGENFIQFVKGRFKNKIKFSVIIPAVTIQVFIFLIILLLVSKSNEANSIFTVSSTGMFIYFFMTNLLAGPLGEELGWRGFAQIELQKKHSSLMASIIIGFWWGMWHLPIWFTTGLAGIDLIQYILYFMIAIIATKIVMTAFYNLNQNLIVPIIIHQFFNFFAGVINGNVIDIIMYNAIFYLAAAVLISLINPKNVLYGDTKQ